MKQSQLTRVKYTLIASAFGASFGFACMDDGGGGAGNGDAATCGCAAGQLEWFCTVYFGPGSNDYTTGCASSVVDAQNDCGNWITNNNYETYVNDFSFQWCEGLEPGETGDPCAAWTPGSHITYNTTTNTYEIDKTLVEDIIADPSYLVYCDSAHITVHSSTPIYGIDDIVSGDLADELGLQNGDRFTSLDSLSLDGKDDLMKAFAELWLGGETNVSLVINRPGGPAVTLNYEIIP